MTSASGIVVLTDVVGGLESADAPTKTGVLAALADLLARAQRGGRRRHGPGRGAAHGRVGAPSSPAAMAVLTQRAAAAAASAGDPRPSTPPWRGSKPSARRWTPASGRWPSSARRSPTSGTRSTRRSPPGATCSPRPGGQGRPSGGNGAAGAGRRRRPGGSQRRPRCVRHVLRHRFAGGEGQPHGRPSSASWARPAGPTSSLSPSPTPGRRLAGWSSTTPTLFDADGSVRLGSQRFGVNTTPFDLHLAPVASNGTESVGDGGLELRLTGTDLVDPLPPDEVAAIGPAADAGPPVRDADRPAGRVPRVRAARGRQVREPTLGPRSRAGSTTGSSWASTTPTPPGCSRPRRRCGAHPGLWIDGTVRAAGAGWLLARDGAERHDLDRRLSAVRALGRRAARRRLVNELGPAIADWAAGEGLAAVDGAEAAGYLVDHGDRLAVSVEADALAAAGPGLGRGVGHRPGGGVARRRRRLRRRRRCRRPPTATSRCPMPGSPRRRWPSAMPRIWGRQWRPSSG